MSEIPVAVGSSRVAVFAPRKTVREKVATYVEIFWNPLDNSAVVKFWIKELVTDAETGDFIGIEDCHDGDQLLAVQLDDVIDRSFDTPLGPITGRQIFVGYKVIFDTLHAEREAMRAAANQGQADATDPAGS